MEKKTEYSAPLTAAIIAGGKSRRFGSHKALAVVNGKRLIDHAIGLARKIAPHVMLNYSKENYFTAIHDVVFVADEQPNCGPLGGIYSVLRAAATPWVAILPCDMPLLPPAVYDVLRKRRIEQRPVVAVSNLGMEPLVSIWPTVLSAPVKSLLNREEYSLRSAIRKFEGIPVFLPDVMENYRDEFFLNVNRLDDLRRLKKLPGISD